MRVCNLHGCDRAHRAKGLCGPHLKQLERGTLGRPVDAPRYRVSLAGRPQRVEFSFDFKKIDGVWHRRPVDTDDPWVEVVWSEQSRNLPDSVL